MHAPGNVSCSKLRHPRLPCDTHQMLCGDLFFYLLDCNDDVRQLCFAFVISCTTKSRLSRVFFQIKFPTLIPAHRYFLSPLLQVEFSFPLILLDERNSTFITISFARPLLLPGASWWVLRLLHSAIFHYTSLRSYSHIQGRGRYATI